MFRVHCQCDKALKLPNEMLGKAAQCPKCKKHLRIVAAHPAHEPLPASAMLVIEDGPQRRGEQIFLAGSEALTMGKAESAPLRLQSPAVSRQHGELIRTALGWRVEDRDSTNGLFVNNRRVETGDLQSGDLHNGDLITIGDFMLRYRSLDDDTTQAPSSSPVATTPQRESAIGMLSLLSDDEVMQHTAIHSTSAVAPSKAKTKSPGNQGMSACPNCDTPLAPDARICVHCGTDLQTGQRIAPAATSASSRKDSPPGSLGAYFTDCLGSFAFFIRPDDLMKFLVIAVVYLLRHVFGFLVFWVFWGTLGLIAILGLYCSFLFNTVVNAASGEKSLPNLSMGDGWVDDFLAPIFKFMAAAAVVCLPVAAYVIITGVYLGGASAVENLVADPIFVSLAVLAAFCWPMIVLILALGGIACLGRPDLIARTIWRSYVPYVLTVTLTAIAVGITYFAAFFLQTHPSYFGGHPLVASIALDVVNVYFSIVAMRCIGLYYHHFKGRFAWSWG